MRFEKERLVQALGPVLAISDLAGQAQELEPWVQRLTSAGVKALQLREKDCDDRSLYHFAREAVRLVSHGGAVLVNGRPDVALAAGARGVHLPAAGLPSGPLLERFGRELLVGRSTHSIEEVRAAHAEGLDYVTFGPVFSTPSKAKYGPPVGVEALREATRCGIAVYALGGVRLDRLSAVAEAGACGFGAIRATQSKNLEELVSAAEQTFGPRTA